MSKRVIIPIDLSIVRFYRMYVTVDEGTPKEDVVKEAKRIICDSDNPDEEFQPDPEIYEMIEEHDIVSVIPDYEGIMDDLEE